MDRIWWHGCSGERYWLEATDRDDIGADLRAPLTDESGKDNWRYTLFRLAAPGDIVYHYDKKRAAIVARSVIAEPIKPREITWGARGTYARAKGVQAHLRNGYSIELTDTTWLSVPVSLQAIREREVEIGKLLASLAKDRRTPLYFPFEVSDKRPIRLLQGYAFKLPSGFVSLFQSAGLEEGIRYPFASYSWLVLSADHAVKEGDLSCFAHDGSAIPKDVTSFFRFNPGEGKRSVRLIFCGVEYEGGLIPDESGRARLFWRGGLADVFKRYREGGSPSNLDWRIHFRRKPDTPDTYMVDLVELAPGKPRTRNTAPKFKPGFAPRQLSTAYTQDRRAILVNLRHNALQHALYERLAAQYGAEKVGTEFNSGIGIRVDVVVNAGDDFQYFEIKTEATAKACLRLALGQLLEYSYWPGARVPSKIVVAGPAPLDPEASAYVAELKERFGLPLEYVEVAAPD